MPRHNVRKKNKNNFKVHLCVVEIMTAQSTLIYKVLISQGIGYIYTYTCSFKYVQDDVGNKKNLNL
jgi:hypothetical protein